MPQIIKNPKNYILGGKPTFYDASWDKVAEIAARGKASKYFAVGDERDIELSTGEVITVAILDFDHDDLADGSGKAPISIGMKNLLAAKYRMGNNNVIWSDSEMRGETLATIFEQLPVDLQAVIKQVNKKWARSQWGEYKEIRTSVDKLFLLAMAEVYASESISGAGVSDIRDYATEYNSEGTQYKYYENLIGNNNGSTSTNSALRKRLANGAATSENWVLRTKEIVTHGSMFRFISKSGSLGRKHEDDEFGVSFAFCI